MINKQRFSKIVAKADAMELRRLAEPAMQSDTVRILREPAKTMVMIRMKESVAKSDFYLGELLAAEAMVEIDGVKGFALMAGDDLEKALDAAVLDALCTRGEPDIEKRLLMLEQKQLEEERREIALHQGTQVKFETLDTSY